MVQIAVMGYGTVGSGVVEVLNTNQASINRRAGDEININFDTGEVWVNGELLDEPYIAEPTRKKEDVDFPQIVPEGCVFVMGDNRNGSTDSRNSLLGMVDERYILGHVLTIVYPFERIGAL